MGAKTRDGEEHSYLLARSSLDSFLSYVREYAVDAPDLDRGDLANSWKRAADRMEELREHEPERADNPVIEALPASWRPMEQRLRQDPIFQRAFSDSEFEIALVDLDHVVVSQKLVSLGHVGRIRASLSADASGREPPQSLFERCLPTARQLPPTRRSRISDDEFAFVSQSNDLRFLEAVLLKPEQIIGYQATGPIAGIVGLVVGYGSNCLHVLSINGRLILNNGHHRACALWRAGIRRVPCVVQTITHPDELEVHGPSAVARNPAFYLTEPRPPLVGDYFDPLLSKSVWLNLTSKEVRVGYSVNEHDIP